MVKPRGFAAADLMGHKLKMNRWDEGDTHDAAMAPLGTTLSGNMIPLASQAGIETLLAGKLPVAANS